jgi:Arc/MetJ family transcription regulator
MEATNLDLDDKRIEEARQLGGHKTKRDAVTRALEEYVRWLRQQVIVSDFGASDYDAKFDQKKQRRAA